MAQLYFRYGTMNSGKTLDLIKVAHNYQEQGKTIIAFKPSTDTREVNIKTRVGLSLHATSVSPNQAITVDTKVDCILVDEAQFLSIKNIDSLVTLVDEQHIPVICYGLKNDFMGHLFKGTAYLMAKADKLEEIKTVCELCNHKATHNLLINNDKPVYTGGNNIIIGDKAFHSVCRYHYYHPDLAKIKEVIK